MGGGSPPKPRECLRNPGRLSDVKMFNFLSLSKHVEEQRRGSGLRMEDYW